MAEPATASVPISEDRGLFRRRLRCALLFVVIGLSLRLWLAWHWADGQAAEWEADGFVRAWEELGWAPLNRARPPLHGALLHAGAALFGATSVLGVRCLSAAVSLAGLAGALLLTRAVSQAIPGSRRSWSLALLWVCGCWSVFPSLVMTAARPTADALAGGTVCAALAAVVSARQRGGVLRWTAFALGATAALLVGGIIVAAAMVAGLIVFLVPVPPLRVAGPLVLCTALAFGAAWFVQRGDRPARPWLPDTAPILSIAALVDAQLPDTMTEALDPDVRATQAWQATVRTTKAVGPIALVRAFVNRLVGDLLSFRRFGDANWYDGLLGVLDLFLRGGLLLFSLATLALVPRNAVPCFPRGGVVALTLALGCAAVLAAMHPFALASVDTLVLGFAGAGLAVADPQRAGLRRLAFCIGGFVLAVLGWSASLQDRPSAPWLSTLHQEFGEGRYLVRSLADGGPADGTDEQHVANVFMGRTTPLLCLPEPALRHALAASRAAPLDDLVMATLVTAEVENLNFEAAADFASTLLAPDGIPSSRGRYLADWVKDSERRWHADGRR